MDQLHLLFLLSFSMLAGSYFSGIVPMAFKLSDSRSRLMALMGSGILVGTALSIIIPEGINSIYSQCDPSLTPNHVSHLHAESGSIATSEDPLKIQQEEPVQAWVIGISLVAGFILMLFIDQFSLYQNSPRDHSIVEHAHHDYILANQDDNDLDVVYINDQISKDISNPNEASSETKPIKQALDSSTSHRFPSVGLLEGTGETAQTTQSYNHHSNSHSRSDTKVTPTLGLVIHAAADGIALGAAATTSHRQVEMIIFLAIMLHKAPAAFSLVVLLLHKGLKHSTIRRHLMAFSLSAPLATILTYFGLSQSGKEALRRNKATGIAMLFSGGTFLYVATVHVLPDLVHNRLLSLKELLFLVSGAFLPVLLAQTI